MLENENLPEKELMEINKQLAYVNNVCTSEESFSQRFNFSQQRGPSSNDHDEEAGPINNIREFLLAVKIKKTNNTYT